MKKNLWQTIYDAAADAGYSLDDDAVTAIENAILELVFKGEL